MRRAYSLLLALAATLPLAGCYYDPGYVRSSQGGGDAYYGTETTTVVQSGGGFYDEGYGYPGYGYGYGFGPGYYGGYNDIVLGSAWYGGRGYDRRYYRGGDGRGHDWHGRPGDGDHRPGGWQGGDHRPPGGWQGGNRPGGWQGGNRPGGWQGGGRPPPPGGWHGGGRPSQGASSNAHSAPRGNYNRGSGGRYGH